MQPVNRYEPEDREPDYEALAEGRAIEDAIKAAEDRSDEEPDYEALAEERAVEDAIEAAEDRSDEEPDWAAFERVFKTP